MPATTSAPTRELRLACSEQWGLSHVSGVLVVKVLAGDAPLVVEYVVLGDADVDLTAGEQADIEARYRRLGLGADSSIIVSRAPVASKKPSTESKRRPEDPPKLDFIRRQRLDPEVDVVGTNDALVSEDAPVDGVPGLLEPPPLLPHVGSAVVCWSGSRRRSDWG